VRFLLDSPALAPEVVQLYRTARKRNSSVWGISQTVEDFVGTEFQPRVHGPGILKNASTKIIGQQPGDVTPMVNHLNLNPVAVNQVKAFGAPRKGRSAEVLLVIEEKAETTQTIRIVPTPLSYWICTTFPRERKYRAWFLKKHEGKPLLQCYQDLARIGYYVSNTRPAGRCSTRLAHSLGLAHSLTAPEIADLLGLTLTTVKIRLHRARRKLQQIMERGCAVSDDNRGVHTCHPKS